MRKGRTDEVAELKARLEQLATRVAEQEEEIRRLRARAPMEKAGPAQSRRRMLKRVGAAAVGLALGSAALANETQQASAAANLSGTNTVDSTALVRPSASFTPPLPTMQVDAEQSPLTVTQNAATALLATGTGTNTAIIAVSGPSDVSAADFTVGGISSGTLKPASVQGRSGGANGNLGLHGISDGQAGVVGQAQTISQVTQRFQANDSSGLFQAGVIGLSDNGLGVVAASATSSGLYANSSSPQGYSVYAARGGHNLSGTLTNPNLAPLYIEPSTTGGPPTDNGHRKGELHIDSNGKVYVCAVSGSFTAPPPAQGPVELRRPEAVGIPSPGTFNQLNSLIYLNSPIRVLGSPNSNYPSGTFQSIGSTAFYVKLIGPISNYASGAYPALSDNIPATATAVFGTVVAFGAAATGFLTIFPANANLPAIATMTYAPGGAFTSSAFSVKLGQLPSLPSDPTNYGIGIVASVACQISLDIVGYVV